MSLNRVYPSIQIAGDPTVSMSSVEKLGAGLSGLGLLSLLIAGFAGQASPILFLVLSLGLLSLGGVIFSVERYLKKRSAGVNNNGVMFAPSTRRSFFTWNLAILITGFYVLLYWFPETLEGLIRMVDPVSYTIRGKAADQWFLYGTFYTVAVLVMGFRAILKYRHNRYQIIRTASVMFFQLVLAFLIPAILIMFQKPEFYFSYFWPLKYDYFFPGTFDYLEQSGGWGIFMVRWAVVMAFVGVPVLTYFFGKRWYCSWVCGCGGLAETAGDQWRQLSDKSMKAWKVERWMIHSVLAFITVTTALVWINTWQGGALLGDLSQGFSKTYGFLIGMAFSGVVGVGFYPVMGARVWCRFGCPQAAILGLLQKYFSRFRITTNSAQC
ncbi:MAG: 4Fe-4S binding protein, partial [Candidatus Kapaibacterium sp.]